jgi:hypothetical protein
MEEQELGLLNDTLQRFGYISIASEKYHAPGTLITEAEGDSGIAPCLVVIGPSSHQEFVEQSEWLGKIPTRIPYPFYHRVIAE